MKLRNFLARLRTRKETARIRALSDRQVMAADFIPALAAMKGSLLWIGTRVYTADDYARLERCGAEVWTTDIDIKAARWGHPTRHRIGDACALEDVFPGARFDAVICNGVFGFGVDTPQMQTRSLASIARVLKPQGLLLLGWNTDRISDPVAAGLTAPLYAPVDFAGRPSRTTFEDVTHVYDCLRKR